MSTSSGTEMPKPEEFVYDRVPYHSSPITDSHPDRLATLALLHGMNPAPVDHCRVLELGCGTGANLIPMAFTLPGSRFLGVDLARDPIRQAQSLVEELGLRNCEFRNCDLTGLDPAFGEFDYIIAHGVYSWIPKAARDALLALCGSCLAPHGVAYVSYNAYPGCHVREITRDLMRFYTSDSADPESRVRQTLEIASLFTAAERVAPVLQEELKTWTSREPWVLFHDDLAEINHPVYFREFVDHARRYSLEFLAEAQYFIMHETAFPDAVAEQVRAAAGGDRVRKQQCLDFLKCCRFHETLLCRQGIPIEDPPDPRRVERLFISSPAAAASPAPDPSLNAAEEFRREGGSSLRTNLPLAKAAILHLGRAWPRPIPFEELLQEARAAGGAFPTDREVLAKILLQCYVSGFVDLHTMSPQIATEASERSRAFPLARIEARHGKSLTTLRHTTIEVLDDLVRQLVGLLDGTRDRAALLRDLQPFAGPEPLRLEDLDRNLDKLARGALLES
jgi:SAM-dependent methyltransferase